MKYGLLKNENGNYSYDEFETKERAIAEAEEFFFGCSGDDLEYCTVEQLNEYDNTRSDKIRARVVILQDYYNFYADLLAYKWVDEDTILDTAAEDFLFENGRYFCNGDTIFKRPVES